MRFIIFLFAICININAFAQEETPPDRLQYHISVGQYSASLGVPSFSAFHPGVNTGITLLWNNHVRHQIFQTGNIGYFYHQNLQNAIQVYTEGNYTMKFGNGLAITPLSIGGGYVLSIPDLKTLEWNSSTQQYEEKNFAPRHNWLISVGSSISLETNLILIHNRKTTFFIDYRIQVQGILIKENVPIIAYTPIRIGMSFPLKENIRGFMYKKGFFN